MNPVLTIWIDPSTAILSTKVSAALKEAGGQERYDLIRADELSVEKLAEEVTKKYRSLIRLTDSDTTLHIVVVMPLFEASFNEQIEKIEQAISIVPDKVSVHIFALRKTLARILDDSTNKDVKKKDLDLIEARNIEILDEAASKEVCTFTIIDDYVESGAPLNFSLNSLAEYISFILLALTSDYHKIFPPLLLTGENGRNIAIGISNLRFNRRGASDLLLHKTFIKVLERSGINQKEVDSQKCLSVATQLLHNISSVYPKFYKETVEPLYKDSNISEGAIVAKVGPPMKKKIDEIEEHITSFMARTDLSLPEKEGVLALMLGSDNAHLRGVQYDQTTMLVDDICNQPVSAYIGIFNSMAEVNRANLLPIRGQFPLLKKYKCDEDKEEYVENLENKEAFDPLPEIKRLKREILDSAAFLRRKTDELYQLEELVKQRDVVDRQNKNYIPERSAKQTDIKEQPLDEQYAIPPGVKPKDSVDLRSFFSEIRNQGSLGSCATFAVVSMYEAIVNRLENRVRGSRANLSEQFVYYYSNVLTGRPEGGSNFYDQLKVLGSQGVCEESLFGYTSGNLSHEPSQNAIENALEHRVLKAKQIPLIGEGDKVEAIQRNHKLLTTALTQGYPVGIALKLYDSFGKNGAYVNRPTESEVLAGEIENHAMVVVGYSENNGSYIVRNSWGKDFGDKGYCYISSSYIDDLEFNMFSCIITETTEEGSVEDETPEMVAPLAGTQTEIEMAAIRNTIDKVSVMLANDQSLYEEYYRYYSMLMQQLCVPKVRAQLRKEAESLCCRHLDEISEEREKADTSFVSEFKGFKQQLLATCLKVTVVSVILIILSAVILFAFPKLGNDIKIFSLAIAALSIFVVIYMWIDKKSRQRRKHRELEDEMQRLAVLENKVRQELLEKQLKYHVAGMWIDSVHNLKMELEKKYNRLQSYIKNLRVWMEEDLRGLSDFHVPDGSMFISLGTSDLFSEYFELNRDELVQKIDLMETFHGYSIDSETIQEARKRLNNSVSNAVDELFEDFRIYDYLTGNKRYSYVEFDSTDLLTGKLVNLGQPASRHTTVISDFPMRLILVNLQSDQEERQLNNTMAQHFPSHIDILRIEDQDSLTLLTLRAIPIEALR